MTEFYPRSDKLIKEEIRDLEAYLNGLPDELNQNYAFVPYQDRLTQLKDELYYSQLSEQTLISDSFVDLRFLAGFETNSIPAQFLGTFLQIFQQLVDSLGQFIFDKPTKRGFIAQNILEKTQLQVVAFSHGSFAVRLKVGSKEKKAQQLKIDLPHDSDILENELQIFKKLEALLSSSESKDRLVEIISSMKSRVASNYSKLLQLLDENQYSISMALLNNKNKGKISKIQLKPKTCNYARQVIQEISDIEVETLSIRGKLTAANLRTGSFEIDLGEEGTIQGKVDPDRPKMLLGEELGSELIFKLLEKTETHLVTGETTVSYQLVSFFRDRHE